MKRATKIAGLVVATAVCVTSMSMLVACGDDPADTTKNEYTVTYYDGTKELKKETVKEGEKATRWTPTKENYTFVDWYATPNFAHKFDFDAPITENKSAFAQFASATQSDDTRDFYIVGSGVSPVLMESNWGNSTSDKHKMTKTEGKNEYTYTVDLYEGDKFQFEITGTGDWQNQRGAGYLTETKLDGTTVFSGAQTIGDNSSYRLDIKCEYSGNYTFTLTTHPDDDIYETNHPSYTEDNKEAFNINPLDTLSWKRNGNAPEITEKITDYFIKGSGITDWKNMVNASTKMTNKNGAYSLEVYLKANEEFMFASQFTVGTAVSEGNLYIKADYLDEASKAYIDQKPSLNMVAKASGTYTFTFTEATNKLTVAFDATKTPVLADYYLDGTYDGGNWGDFMGAENKAEHKFTETVAGAGVFVLENVALEKDGQMVIRAYPKDESELTWNNGLGNFNYTYLYGGGNDFSAVDGNNLNIKVLTAGNYDITFDSYSKMITIAKHVESKDNLDIYIKGKNINGWAHNWSEDYLLTISEDELSYEYVLTVEESKAVEFGLEKHPKGEKEGYGTYLGASAMGTSGDANDKFKPESGTNFTCSVAGTYKIVYTIATGTLDFYAVSNA